MNLETVVGAIAFVGLLFFGIMFCRVANMRLLMDI
jgi:hypothetical protein